MEKLEKLNIQWRALPLAGIKETVNGEWKSVNDCVALQLLYINTARCFP
jgi:hypothetical protein